MEETDFTILLRAMFTTDIKGIIKDYNDRCIKEGRKADKIKGYSGYKKDELIDMLCSFFDLDEKKIVYSNIAPDFKKNLVELTIDLITGKDKREKIVDIQKEDDPKGIILEIKGFSWEVEAYVYFSDEKGKFDRDCNCRIGAADGICKHQLAIFLMMLSSKVIKISDIPIKINYPWFSEFENMIKNLSVQTKSKDEADIEWADDYQIFIDGNIIITQWGGSYPGKKTIDASLLDETAEDWITKKVTDKILKRIKVTKVKDDPDLVGYPNLPIKDNHDVISKIMSRPKLVKKILNKFKKILEVEPDLPTNDADLVKFLKSKI